MSHHWRYTPTDLTARHEEVLLLMLANERAGASWTAAAAIDRRLLPRLTKGELIEPAPRGDGAPSVGRFTLTLKGLLLARRLADPRARQAAR